jgi:hypothetical protein
MKKFKTFTVKIEEGDFERLEKCVKHYAESRNGYVVEAIMACVESDEDGMKVTPKQVTPNEVTPKKEQVTPKNVPIKVTPKLKEIANLQALVDKKQVIPNENLGNTYTKAQALGIVKRWYQKNPDPYIKNSVIETQAEELVANPSLIRYYE